LCPPLKIVTETFETFDPVTALRRALKPRQGRQRSERSNLGNTSETNALDDVRAASMTKVQAIVREQRLDAIIERLLLIGVRGLTLGVVRGSGDGATHREVFRGSSYRVDYVSKILIEWYGPDEEADAVIRAIQQRASTGEAGDGTIISLPVEEAVRIRTGERGLDAV
jgi:nitrogen regulatory protein P-II 1